MSNEEFAGNTTATTTTVYANGGADATGSQPDFRTLYEQALKESAEWKNRFNGLQGTYQREQQKWKSDADTLTGMKSTLDAITAEKTGLQSLVDDLNVRFSTLQTEREVESNNLERMKIVVEEFPQLTSFLTKGLIPDGNGDELRQKLKSLSETVTSLKDQVIDEFRAGGSPPQPPRPKTETKKSDLQVQLMEAFRNNDLTTYDRLYNEILKSGGQNG